MPAPIALFVYNRVDHAQRTLDALRNNQLASESEIIVYSDGPKRQADGESVARVRAHLRDIRGFKRVTVVERETNMGLARSIIAGVSETVARSGEVIVLEDDMVTSPFFLRYMNEALELYRHEERVISIAAYVYPVTSPLPTTFFLRGADCWGWATWKRGWDLFEPDGRKLLDELVRGGLTRRFDFDGTFGYTRMLRKQIAGRNDSWAIRWYASAFLKDRVTLYPGKSLLQNIGNDGSGTHSSPTDVFDIKIADGPARLERLKPVESEEAARAVRAYFRATHSGIPALVKRAWRKFLR